jgi:hypothetical protein
METALVGSDLLNAVRGSKPSQKTDLIKSCGYVENKADGSQQVKYIAFYEALLAAKGFDLFLKEKEPGKRGRSPSYTTCVHSSGNVVIGKAYLNEMNCKPGDEFEIKVTKTGIRLVPKFEGWGKDLPED